MRVARYVGACEIVRHRWEQPAVTLSGVTVVPVVRCSACMSRWHKPRTIEGPLMPGWHISRTIEGPLMSDWHIPRTIEGPQMSGWHIPRTIE